jgi:AcrR family transcriptional regulator
MATNHATDVAERPVAGSLDDRILAAAPRCIARWGLAKTTLDDLAREAGCSRASIYRRFPGGKDHVLAAALLYEEARFFDGLADALAAAASLEDLVVTGLVGAARFVDDNDALQYLLEHEPELILPHIAFDRVGPMLYRVAAFAGPYLERFLAPADTALAAEWCTRLLLSYTLHPSEHLDLRDEVDTRRFVRTFVLPAFADGDT